MITVIGAGLAGSLLALELASLGRSVTLLDAGGGDTATALSYGLIRPGAGPFWRSLRRRHDIGGLQRRWLQFGPRGWPLPALQMDPERFAGSIPDALQQLGVERRRQRLEGSAALAPLLAEGAVVLACGSGCRALAPALSDRLRSSWAGILELSPEALPQPWLARLPSRFERLALERRAAQLEREEWIVDAGLVPCGARLLAGQITLVRPGLDQGPDPDSAAMEQRLRAGLAHRWPELAELPGRYRQAPVSFSSNGVPLAEACGPDLWVLAGFSGAFTDLPAAAAGLAAQIHTQTR